MKNSQDSTLTLLFVDDDSDESYLFNEALEHSGLHVHLEGARDGNALLHYLNTRPLPDIVLVDLNMPHKDGMEALIEIRSNPAFDHLPLVIYSTSNNKHFIEQCYQNGASLFAIKPNDFDGMVEVAKSIVSYDWKLGTRVPKDQFVVKAREKQVWPAIVELKSH